MKRRFKHQWSTIPTLSTKQTTTSHVKSLNKKHYDTGAGWEQAKI